MRKGMRKLTISKQMQLVWRICLMLKLSLIGK